MELSFGKKMVILVGLFALCMTIGVFIVSQLMRYNGYELNDIAELLNHEEGNVNLALVRSCLGISHLMGFFVTSIAFALLVYKTDIISYFGIHFPISLASFFQFLALLILSYPLMGVIVFGLQQLDLPVWAQGYDSANAEVIKSLLTMNGLMDLFATILVVSIFPGIGEELLFRGVLQNELQRKFPQNSIWPIMIAAAIFAAVHGEVMGFFPKFIIGLILGYAYFKTKNLMLPILIHALNNGLQVLSVYALGVDKITEMEKSDMTGSQIMFSFLTLPFILYIIKSIEKNSHGASA